MKINLLKYFLLLFLFIKLVLPEENNYLNKKETFIYNGIGNLLGRNHYIIYEFNEEQDNISLSNISYLWKYATYFRGKLNGVMLFNDQIIGNNSLNFSILEKSLININPYILHMPQYDGVKLNIKNSYIDSDIYFTRLSDQIYSYGYSSTVDDKWIKNIEGSADYMIGATFKFNDTLLEQINKILPVSLDYLNIYYLNQYHDNKSSDKSIFTGSVENTPDNNSFYISITDPDKQTTNSVPCIYSIEIIGFFTNGNIEKKIIYPDNITGTDIYTKKDSIGRYYRQVSSTGNAIITISMNSNFVNYTNIEIKCVIANEYIIQVSGKNSFQPYFNPNSSYYSSDYWDLPSDIVAIDRKGIYDFSNLKVVKFNYGKKSANSLSGLSLMFSFKDLIKIKGELFFNFQFYKFPVKNGIRFQDIFSGYDVSFDFNPSRFFNLSGSVYNFPLNYRTVFSYDTNYYPTVFDNDDNDNYPGIIHRFDSYVLNTATYVSEPFESRGNWDRNRNGIYDYDEDFLMTEIDSPLFLFGRDKNNNLIIDNAEDDLVPDYTYGIDIFGYDISLKLKYNNFNFEINKNYKLKTSLNKQADTFTIIGKYDTSLPRYANFSLYYKYKFAKDLIYDNVNGTSLTGINNALINSSGYDNLLFKNTVLNKLFFKYIFLGFKNVKIISKIIYSTFDLIYANNMLYNVAIHEKLDYKLNLFKFYIFNLVVKYEVFRLNNNNDDINLISDNYSLIFALKNIIFLSRQSRVVIGYQYRIFTDNINNDYSYNKTSVLVEFNMNNRAKKWILLVGYKYIKKNYLSNTLYQNENNSQIYIKALGW